MSDTDNANRGWTNASVTAPGAADLGRRGSAHVGSLKPVLNAAAAAGGPALATMEQELAAQQSRIAMLEAALQRRHAAVAAVDAYADDRPALARLPGAAGAGVQGGLPVAAPCCGRRFASSRSCVCVCMYVCM